MLAAKEGILDLRATVGSLQEAVERAEGAAGVGARHAGSRADQDRRDRPAGGGLGLPVLEVQLESIYTVTSRLANLRFSNFMR